jgi:hypothetical protein
VSAFGLARTRYGPDREHQSRTARRARTRERLPPIPAGRAGQPRRAAIDRYRGGEIDAYTVDETIHHYHRAAGELWKFCFARGGGTHAELIAGVLDRMTVSAEAIDWWERATPPRRQ